MAFNRYMSSADGKPVGISSFFKPTDEKSVSTSLAVVGGVAIIEQNVLIFTEELVYNDERDRTDVRIVRRAHIIYLGDCKLVSVTASNRILFEETYTIEYASSVRNS